MPQDAVLLMRKCPYCGSNEVEYRDTVDTVDAVDEDYDNIYYVTIELFECLECGKVFDDEGMFIEQKRKTDL